MSPCLLCLCERKRELERESERANWSGAFLIFLRVFAFAVAAAAMRRRIGESSSMSSSSSGIDYEVFLNFRGADTRAEFTDLLHENLKNAGIEVFKDDEKLRAGEEISQGLKDAIKRSRISIAIFSKDYASSKSRLMELVQMWECRQSDGQTIIPIFYDVSPYDVRHQAGDFATAFEKHEKDGKVDPNTIKRWKEVLGRVGGLMGFERNNINRGYASDLLGSVLKRVWEVLKKDDQVVSDKLVGIDLHVEEIMRKLGVVYNDGQAIKICGEDVRVVIIGGMPGVGKTTLAKIVFNKMYKSFDGCSFLENVNLKEVELSEKLLIADLLRKMGAPLRPSKEGNYIIRSRLSNMKVLIVLDDLRMAEQIEALVEKLTWFGPGSRIIVTTARRDIFIGLKDEAAFEEYEVQPMRDHHALQLFCMLAFQGDDALQDVSEYGSLSIDIVRALGGHPLSIVLWSHYLRHNRMYIEIWRQTSDLLKRNGRDSVQQKVEASFWASYVSLNDNTMEIFLDIACFFIGKDEMIASYMWEACDYFPAKGLKLLRDMYMLEIGENNEMKMHDLLRKFGRRLVRSSRIWNTSHALSILRDGKGTENVEGISLSVDEGCTVCFTCKEFHKMLNLRYLGLDQANIQGTSENLLPNLRWLEWPACRLISELGNMHLKKLIILDLSESLVTGESQVWRRIMEKMEELKVLNLQGCVQLPASLNFPAPIKLEILILEDCTELAQIGPFISNLKNLRSLNLRKCRRVRQLPQELGRMKSLRELLIDGTGICSICFPEGFMENLEILSARDCKELKDISAIGSLRNLTNLALDDSANIDWDPAFEFPRKLRTPSLRNCKTVNELPQSIGELTQLEEMDLSGTEIKEMPPSIGNLSNLKTLKMGSTRLQNFPEEIVKLVKLKEIDFSDCRSLEGQVCCDISGLSSLRILRLGSSNVAGLPPSICHLSCLQTLDLLDCDKLQALPKLPSSLLRFLWGSSGMIVPDLSYLTTLKEILLKDVEQPKPGLLLNLDIGWITRLTSLETLELSLPKVTNVPENFSALTQLRELTLSYMKELDLTRLPSSCSLWTLRLKHCKIREPKFSSLKFLSELEVDHCDLAKIDGLAGLRLLEVLKIFHCSNITNLNELIKLNRLRVLNIIQDSSMTNLNELEDVKQPKDGVEAAIESREKMKDEAGQRPADMETSYRSYAIATVQNIVEIDGRVEQITDLLEMEVNDEVRIIGIYGADGIGKTTLAKALYDQISFCFDGRSFLTEVKETTQNPRGIQFLQTKLIRDIVEREGLSLDERIEDFLDKFRAMKVLLVVDDVEKPSDLHAIVGDQLHWFGPGSRIIVTSENEEILKEYDPDRARTYMVSELDVGQAFKLFCRHAFRMQSSVPHYDGLSNRIVNATEKLPLAVEVVGSFLRGKSIQEWKKMEKSMKAHLMSSKKTTVGLQEILNICYGELDQQQKDIFLDIACFVSGVDARIASYMWPNSYLPSSDCTLMPLAKIGENNELQMHRLLRCFGKRILNEEGSGDPIGRKFYIQDMVPKAISWEKRMENFEAVSFNFTAGDFQSMPDIRFLKLDNAKVSGNFVGAFANLRWFCWQRCPLEFDAFNFVLRELVILDLSWSKVTEDWGGWTEIKMEKLKVLNLTGCSDLPITPNFSGYKDLEILILERCSQLKKLDPSIGHLKHLVSLNLNKCSRFNVLPDELGCLTALKELFIEGTSVRQIPISIGNLKELEILRGFKCSLLTNLASSISYLTALSELSLDGAKISELPSSLGHLLKLRRLSLRNCRYLEGLPYSIDKMVLLEELDISGTSFSELPNSIGNLQSLRVLRMDSSFIRAFPGEIGNLTNLEELDASHCWNLKGAIPSDIKGLCHLRSLTLGHSSISSLPSEISTISGLHTLDLFQCNEIEELPKLPSSLICLRVSSERMQAMPLLENLKELEQLCLSDGDPKARRPPLKQPMPESNVEQMIDEPSFSISFPKLRKLELSLSQVIKLKFEPTDIPQLKTPTLPGLSLKEVSNMLSVFKLYHSVIEEIEGLERLKALKSLYISNCNIRNLNGIDRLTSLRSLILCNCDYLDSLPDLSNLKLLKVLEIRRCKMIHQIEGLEELTSLKKLNISECPAENSVQAQNALKLVMARSVEIWWRGDVIKQGATYLKGNREEILLDTSNEIIETIKDEAGRRPIDMGTSDRNYAIAAVENVIGLDDRAKQITDLLEMEVNDEVLIIGIHGTDGIGKTTLAKAVYDQISSCFDSCSFLAEVEETTRSSGGIQFLQTKLICDILERDRGDPSFDERIEDFLDMFRKMKVLIVVDDVEEQSHLHAIVGRELWFGPGSRIIVTSNKSEILKEFDSDKAPTYMVSELDDGQAFELFCKHAFRMQSSIPDYDGLSNRIVNATEKLPLAVEVVGSFLRGKSIQEWEKMEKSMKERMVSSQKTTVGLEEILDICYRELGQHQKDIFLDIASFISGVDARIASYVWPNCYPSSGCILMPLAKIGENNELQMHRLLRRLGKIMFEQEGSGDPIGRKFYIQEKEMENVEALPFDFTAGYCQIMPELRFLKLNNAKVSGNFEGAFASLRWLCWQRCPLNFSAKNFLLTELVILDLSWSKVTEEWGGWSEIKMKKLKVLNLTGCSDLLFTPDFSGYEYLEILILERCSHLVKLDPSIGHLNRLVYLNLKFCSQLNGLPVELGYMTALKELFIDGTSVREIPISVGNLKELEILSGFNCFPLTHLPSSICYLAALSELSLEGAEVTELPSSLGELLNLRRLSLRDCHYLDELPDSIGKMRSLEELDISATSICELPSSIRNLESLKVLRMDSSFIREFPGEIGNLTKLEELHASWCRSLKGAIPRDIKELRNLRLLTLGHSSISSLPSEIITIPRLHTLDLLQCNEIEVLPELPPSLISLRVSSKRMKVIPLLKGLKELEELCLSDEDLKECRSPSEQPMPESNVNQPLSVWISRLWNLALLQTQRIEKQSFLISFPKLRKLKLSLSQISKLKLELTYSPQLKMLTLSGLSLEEISELPKTLSVLSIQGCSSLKRLPTVQGLNNLSVLELYHSAIEEIEGLEGLKALKRLDISNCKIRNLNGISQLTSLRSLILSGCDNLENLPDLSNLQLLKVPEIRLCKMIHQ